MTEQNKLAMFRMLFFAAMISNFSFWISSFNIYLMFKNIHKLFKEAFSHVATKYLSYIRIYLFKSIIFKSWMKQELFPVCKWCSYCTLLVS